MTTELIIRIKQLYEREFSIKDTLFLLAFNKLTFMRWGVTTIKNFENCALVLEVNGQNFKGCVVVTLTLNDTYSIYFFNKNGKLIETNKNVYFDSLVDVIDTRIEEIENFKI
jgi:hypothetical protein